MQQLIHENLVGNQCFWMWTMFCQPKEWPKRKCECLLSWQAVKHKRFQWEKKWLMWINSTQHMRVKQIHLKHHWDRTEVLKRVSKKIATHRRAVTSVKTDTEYTAKQHTGRNQVCSCRFTDKHLGIGERAQWLTQLTKTQDLPLCRVLTPKALKCLPHLILCPQFRHLGA